MTTEQEKAFNSGAKKVWAIYTVVILIIIAILVAVLADDNEELLFFSIMPAAFAYVFRPGDAFITNAVKSLFGIDPPPSSGKDEQNDKSAEK